MAKANRRYFPIEFEVLRWGHIFYLAATNIMLHYRIYCILRKKILKLRKHLKVYFFIWNNENITF